ncbi:hypothetical protein F5051DRAFT_446094, partial [Lentinula edodes]
MSSNRKLALLIHLILNNRNLLKPEKLVGGDGTVYTKESVLTEQLRRFNVPPFWDPSCPEEFQEKWGARWKDIHEQLKDLKKGGRGEIEKYNFKNRELNDVAISNKSEGWGSCMDLPLKDTLENLGFSIRDRYIAWVKLFAEKDVEGRVVKGFVPLTQWTGRQDNILEEVFGDAIKGKDITPPDTAKTWLNGVIQTYLDAATKECKRAIDSLNATQTELEKILGPEFWRSFEVPHDFDVKKARSVFRKLQHWKSQLAWQVASENDDEIRDEEIDIESPEAPKQIEARWSRLSDQGKKLDYCQMIIGWLVGVIEAKTAKTIEVHLDAGGYDEKILGYGRVLARSIPRKKIDHIPAPSESDFQAFALELADFAEEWVERDETDLRTAISMYENPEVDEALLLYKSDGADIGVGEFRTYDDKKLQEYLGLPEDGLPMAFRRHTADEPAMLADSDGDKPFLNSTPVKISWHQFVFVAAVMLSLTTPKTANLRNIFHSGPADERTIRPVREEWAKVPGICLFDEVGLGKTMCAMATIATLQSLYEIQEKVKAKEMERSKLPACLRDAPSFGNLAAGIPNERHLVVVPNSLMDQWVAEITRFFRGNAIHLHIVSNTASQWEDEIAKVLRTTSVPKINQILVVAGRTLQRMFTYNERSIAVMQNDGIPRLKYQQKPNSVYAIPYCSTFLDEVQDARTGKALWRAFSAILDCSLIKVPMTATPLLESPNDLINLALLVRPPSLVDDQTSNLRGMSRDLRILKGKSTVRTHQEALQLTERDKIMQQTEGSGVAFFASIMVKVVQRHLAPHTVKRTNQSLNFEGKPLGAQLPPHTMIHVRVTVTESEADSSYNAVQDTLKARVFDTNTLGKFFNEARSKLSFPSAEQYTPEEYNLEALQSDSATKLKAAIEIMLRVLRHGADNAFPSEFHSTTDRVVDAGDIGLPDFLSGWEVQPLLPDEPRAPNEKIILFTTYAKFHPWMQNILTCCGIRNVAISGAVSSKERTRLIEEFRHGPVDVLIMSQVGATGLNLTCARTLILYEAAWTAVNTQQTAGRIHRRGQRLPTYVIQLVADKTVEVLLIATGLGKRFLLGTFLELDRNLKTFKMLAGHAGEEYEALTKGVDAGDDVAEEVRQNLKSAQSALGVALQDRFKEGEEQSTQQGKQSTTTSKKRARKVPSTAEKGAMNEEGPKKKTKTSKVKSSEVVHDESPARSMRLAAGPSQINATVTPSRLNAAPEPPSPPQPLEELEELDPAAYRELSQQRAAEFRKVIAAKQQEARNNAEGTSHRSQDQPVQSGSTLGPVMPFIAPGETQHHFLSPPPIPQGIPAPVGPATHSAPVMDVPNPFEPMDFEPVETPTAPVSPQLPA